MRIRSGVFLFHQCEILFMASNQNTKPQTVVRRSVPIDPGTLVRTLSPLPGVMGTIANSTPQIAIIKVGQARRYVYSRPLIQSLTIDEAKACSALAYAGKAGDATPDGKWIITPDAVMKNGVDEAWITGFRAILLISKSPADKRVVLVFAGTDPHSIVDLVTDADQTLNISPFDIPYQYQQGTSLAEKLLKNYGDRLRVTGHSLGGGIANYVSVRLGIAGAGVNAAPLGVGTLLNLLLFGKDDRSKFTHYNNRGEFVSSYAPGNQIGIKCEIENKKGVLEGHMLENVDTNAAMVCYDAYVKSDGHGASGSW